MSGRAAPAALKPFGPYSLFPVSPLQALTEVLFSKTLSMMMIVFKFAGPPLRMPKPLVRSAAELLNAVYVEVEP